MARGTHGLGSHCSRHNAALVVTSHILCISLVHGAPVTCCGENCSPHRSAVDHTTQPRRARCVIPPARPSPRLPTSVTPWKHVCSAPGPRPRATPARSQGSAHPRARAALAQPLAVCVGTGASLYPNVGAACACLPAAYRLAMIAPSRTRSGPGWEGLSAMRLPETHRARYPRAQGKGRERH